MKTYDNLLEPSLTPEAVKECMLDAAKGKLRRKEVLKAFKYFDRAYEIITKCATDPGYFPREDNRHTICDGTDRKRRTIEKPLFCPEQILHHVLMRPFKRILMDGLYEQVYGCLPATVEKGTNGNSYIRKYGPHATAKRLRKWANGKKTFVAELDVHHAYDSVDINILEEKLKETIKDDKWLALMNKFLRGPNRKAKGLVLGHYTSPWLFNFYLKEFDHYAAGLDGVKYLRFADNIFLMGTNKRKVHRAVASIKEYLWKHLSFTINRSEQVYRFEYKDRNGRIRGRAINALGMVIHHNRVTLRKRILKAIRRKAIRIARKEKVTWYDAASMLSRLSWFNETSTKRYYLNHIKPRIDTRSLKRKVRNHSRLMQPIYKERRRIINDGLEKSARLAGR